MTHKPSWQDLAGDVEELGKKQPVRKTLRAEWYAYEGSEEHGIWLLLPGGPGTEEARASFGLFAARAIQKLGIRPIPVPQASQYFRDWELDCRFEEDIARRSGKPIDLSEAVPSGLGEVDADAVDPCTRGWLEWLRRKSGAFHATKAALFLHGRTYKSFKGTIADLCAVSAMCCRRLARDKIAAQLRGRERGAEQSIQQWADLEIRFISDERVQIFIQGRAGDTRNFAEMGFQDDRGNGRKPNAAWAVLRALAEHNGTLPAEAVLGRQAIQKRAQAIRKVLYAQFGLTENPILFVRRTGYVAAFKITRSPACDT